MRALQSGEIDFGIGAIDSSLPAELLVYPLREDPFVVVLHRDDPLAAQPNLPWKQLVGRDIAVFSKGNIQRLVAALVESQRLTLTTRYRRLYRNPLWAGTFAAGGGHSPGAVYDLFARSGVKGGATAAAGAHADGGPDAWAAGACTVNRRVFFSVTVRIALGQVFYQYVHRQMVDVLQRVRGQHPQQPVMVSGDN